MRFSTRAGDGWVWALIGLILVLSASKDNYKALSAGILAVSAGVIIFCLLKRFIQRRRPCDIEYHCWAKLAPPDRYSFPSGHTITAFAVALSVGLYYPATLPGLLACAVAVALSRIFLGMHFLTDVVAGAAIGSGLACCSCRLVESLS
jgi:undecaprenyl-diphosphatase